PRRGVTLVEMLVTVALLVLMMTVLVQVFTAATGAVSASRTYQELDGGLRNLDATIRQDLDNITSRLTPPRSPQEGKGYFEYGENSFADIQGEDTDDYLKFTVKAPEGQIFNGRMYYNPFLPASPTPYQLAYGLKIQPITIQSQYAEVIYFLRNNNLYRRVLLVVPERQSTINYTAVTARAGALPGATVSWQGVTDVSARPSPVLTAAGTPQFLFNTLGDLTNRENRFASPRFISDYYNIATGTVGSDGIPDDLNGDTVNDFAPSLYSNVISAGLVHEPPGNPAPRTGASFQTVAFPWVYQYAYSKPDSGGLFGLGWIHSPDPTNAGGSVAALLNLNHAPIDIGDSLPVPTSVTQNQTWWGFPTWREMLSPNWLDPA
ncbi:MAG: prepilin-type N-terminal cleavage/methylation domain-containing protein, partial [Planctomycetia bacterium]|nr:prepilin-type N-terminal cleavage/methylation domain-containing protein [Planctomycetia bacterium]